MVSIDTTSSLGREGMFQLMEDQDDVVIIANIERKLMRRVSVALDE